MKITDLKAGEIYHCIYSYSKNLYIFKKKADGRNCNNLFLFGRTYYENSGDFNAPNCTFREATQQEKEHFLQCEKANKYVEYKNEEILIFN